MLGGAILQSLAQSARHEVYGVVRNAECKSLFLLGIDRRRLFHFDATDVDLMRSLIKQLRPSVIINCIVTTPDESSVVNSLRSFVVNTLLPHQLACLCSQFDARLIHISTDGVFSGTRGAYGEDDSPDAREVYGRQKFLGEVRYPGTITLRTSLIGHEFPRGNKLIDWLLSQRGSCEGYSRVIFSGLPTIELARVIIDYILPAPNLTGVFHVAAPPISKLHLLRLVSEVYNLSVEIEADYKIEIDRSLNAGLFERETGYKAASWPDLIVGMHNHYKGMIASVQE